MKQNADVVREKRLAESILRTGDKDHYGWLEVK